MGEVVSSKLATVRRRDVARESFAVVRHRDVAKQIVEVAAPGLLAAVVTGRVFGVTSFWEGTVTVGVTVAAMLMVPTVRFLRGLRPASRRLYEQQVQAILAAKDEERQRLADILAGQLQTQIQERAREAWTARYGGIQPTLCERWELRHEAITMHASIEKLAILAKAACGQCFALLAGWLQRLREEMPDTADAWLADFIDVTIVKRGVDALEVLDEQVKPIAPDHRTFDERHSLIGLYQRYHDARPWLFRIALVLNVDLARNTQYQTWLAADERFDRELREVLEQRSLHDVRDHIAAVDRGGGYPAAPP